VLSLAMIVKNEVRTLERTIQAVREHVDEIVIGLDVASSDGTREIAEKWADTLVDIHLTEELELCGPLNGEGDWGFSNARNKVFRECHPDSWRLVLDGHETVLNASGLTDAITEAERAGCDSVEVLVLFEPDEEGVPQTRFGSVRLMRSDVLYKNPIHNLPVTKSTYKEKFVRVEHRKCDQDPESKAERDRQRSKANIEAFRKKLRIDGDDARSWFYLATAYKENGRWDEGHRAFIECLKFSVWNEERWHSRVGAATCHSNLGDIDAARNQYVLAIEEYPEMAEAYYYLGNLAYKQQRYHEARVWLERCVQMDQPQCKLFVNPKIYQVDRYDLLSMTYNHLGMFGAAVEQAEKALKVGANPRIQKNVQIWKECLEERSV